MEDDFLAWKTLIFKKIAEYYDISADRAKELRARPHVPLFQLEALDNFDPNNVFYGEYSKAKPRKWSIAQNHVDVQELG
jgi:hypothetical protein